MLLKSLWLRLLACFFYLYCFSFASLAAADRPQAKPMFSVRPLAILYVEITGESVDEAQILLDADLNVHDYQFKMADLKRLGKIQTLYWLGANMEPQLAKLEEKFPEQTWRSLNQQSHGWLAWQAQMRFIDDYVLLLQKKMPHKADLMAERAQTLKQELQSLFEEAAVKLSGPSGQVLLAHDAFEQWLLDIGLPQPEYISIASSHGHQHKGSRHNMHVMQDIESGKITCLIEEPDMRLVQLKQKFPALRSVLLSPMANQSELKLGQWLAFWQYNLAALNNCLSVK